VEEGFRLRLRKIWHRFSFETKASIKIRRRDDARGENRPWWCGLTSGPNHLCLLHKFSSVNHFCLSLL
jgi:hypothetical protein